ncbi:MAG: amidohydrolase [Lachnospiraceae bacterium]|jgi:predicted amidohydrolase YtcJ|nr:amidohydrolase [Lachnospiraceae bacterium]
MGEIFCNGTILTMEEGTLYTEAVLVEDGRIVETGSLRDLEERVPEARIIDLQGAAMLPAFIDAHSHFSGLAYGQLQVGLEEAADLEEVHSRITAFMEERQVQPGEWVSAKGYDHNLFLNGEHPSLAFLDECAPENPLVLQHKSGHMGVFNTCALNRLGVTTQTEPPKGGVIGQAEGKLTGYMEENAFVSYLKQIPMPDLGMLTDACRKAQEKYAGYGITTVQDGMMVEQMIPLYRHWLAQDELKLDVVGYPAVDELDVLEKAFPESVGRYWRNFRIGGIKVILDGSPQGRTAWMRTPYQLQEGYYGYGTMEDRKVKEALAQAAKRKLQILAHCNGDAAADQYIRCVKETEEKYPYFRKLRPVMIHAQLLGLDQLAKVRKLGILPSFFVAHVYHWGDVHRKNFGEERAAVISPAASALREGIRFTFHQDSPVIEPNMLETVWCAVSRKTRSGWVLGAQEAVTVLEALKAVTIHAAYQYSEEAEKGSIRAGKRADFVILDRNPLEVETEEIPKIRILRTIKEGTVLFSAD